MLPPGQSLTRTIPLGRDRRQFEKLSAPFPAGAGRPFSCGLSRGTGTFVERDDLPEAFAKDLLGFNVDVPVEHDPRPFVEDVDAGPAVYLIGLGEDEDDSLGVRVGGRGVDEFLEEGLLMGLAHLSVEVINLLLGGSADGLGEGKEGLDVEWLLRLILHGGGSGIASLFNS